MVINSLALRCDLWQLIFKNKNKKLSKLYVLLQMNASLASSVIKKIFKCHSFTSVKGKTGAGYNMLQQKALLGKIPREGPWLSLALWTVFVAFCGVRMSVYLSVYLERG